MVLMILLEPVEHIDQGVFILGIFHFFAFELVLLRDRHRRAPSRNRPTGRVILLTVGKKPIYRSQVVLIFQTY